MPGDKPHPADLFIDAVAEAVLAKVEGVGTGPRLMSLKAAAEYLAMSQAGLRDAIANGKIPNVRIDRLIRLDRRDLDGWIEESKV